MSELDDRIRGLVAALVEAAPVPPAFPGQVRRKRRRGAVILAITVATVVVVGVAALWINLDHHAGQTVSVGAVSPSKGYGVELDAFMYLRPVLCQIPPHSASATAASSENQLPAGPAVPLVSPTSAAQADADCAASNATELPTTPERQDLANAYVTLPYYDNSFRYILGPADMTASGNVAHVAVQQFPAGQYSVIVTFTHTGSSEFNLIATRRAPYYEQNATDPPYASLEAFDVDGVVESAPPIEAGSFNGTAVISGSPSALFTKRQADMLAVVIHMAASR